MIIARRFRGPPESGNGGYAAGVFASAIDGPAEVTLRAPPPLDVPFRTERDGDVVRVLAGAQLIAEARPTKVTLVPPAPPSFAEATDATHRYRWFEEHAYPMCFVCGPARAAGDGLRVFPGAVAGRSIVAAPYVIDASVTGDDGRLTPEITWALLDCPSWFGFESFHGPPAGGTLLGRLAARIDERPRRGERCVCVGWFLGRDGRKIRCGAALHGEDGRLLGVSESTWIAAR